MVCIPFIMNQDSFWRAYFPTVTVIIVIKAGSTSRQTDAKKESAILKELSPVHTSLK